MLLVRRNLYSVDWDLRHNRTIQQVAWPADEKASDYWHVTKQGNVRLRLSTEITLQCRSRLVTVYRRGEKIEYVEVSMMNGTFDQVSNDARNVARRLRVPESLLTQWLSEVSAGKRNPLIFHSQEADCDISLEVVKTLDAIEPLGLEATLFFERLP